MTASEPLLVVILGPTASGKTALSIDLAERFAGEIVNCDSVALYRDLEIGTAKPGPAERARVPHHLLDVVAPDELMTAGEYARRARAVLDEIKGRGRLPIIAGGTGLYLRALLEGLAPGPQRSEELRRRLRAAARRHAERYEAASSSADATASERKPPRRRVEGAEFAGSRYLHRILRRLDPAAAAQIHPHDEPKIIRAIEVCLQARRPLTEVWQGGREPLRGFRLLRLGLDPPRAALYARINQRAARMFASGLVEETAALLQKYSGPPPPLGGPFKSGFGLSGQQARGSGGDTLPAPLQSMGYRQAVQLLRREIDLATAISAAQQAHRNYAKRQMTWFRREPDVHWLHGFGDEADVQQQAIELVRRQFIGD